MVRPKARRASGDGVGLALHAAAARVEGLLKERERLLREVGKRKRLIEQARAKAEQGGNDAATKLGPLYLRHQALVRELTALFDALQSEPRPPRARNVIGKLRASLVAKGVLEPIADPDSDSDADPDSDSDPESDSDSDHARRRGRRSASSSRPDFASAQQPAPERRPLREIFRALARALHPDHARTDAERSRRTDLMKELTRAYERGDLARLLELESEWQATQAPAPGASDGSAESLARCQEFERTNRELLKQVRQLTAELKDAKDDARARHTSSRSLARTAATAARELDQLEAVCELVREFKSGNRSLADLALGEFLI